MKDSYYFQHDSNARNDPKMKALINKYGMSGYGRFWVIIEMLRESSKYKLEDEEYVWDAMAEYMKVSVSDVRQFIDDCIAKFKLFEKNEDESFSSPALLEKMAKLDELRSKRKYAADTRWGNDSYAR